jgi:GNAT superfamily N-acetyltransferase
VACNGPERGFGELGYGCRVARRTPENPSGEPTGSRPAQTRELLNGSEITLREVTPDDKEAIAAGFERLSPESRYRRFFSPMKRLSEADLRYLTEVDHRDHEAIVAIGPGDEPVGVARYVRGERVAEAEVAVAVVDDWQGRGAATALLERLVQRARENGIERFVAVVLEENADAIELFRSVASGDPGPRRTQAGQLELIIDLPADGVRGTLLGRALRSAASGRVLIHPWRVLKRRLQELPDVRPEGDNRQDR